jgi:hypothetical protein
MAELAEAVGCSISEVRLGLRRLVEQLAPAGMSYRGDGKCGAARAGGSPGEGCRTASPT